MCNLPVPMIIVMTIFSPLFSNPTYQNLLTITFGHILCKGRRTIADILRQVGLRNVKNFSKYHEFLNRAKWSAFTGSKILLLKLVSLTTGPILISIDSTVERRKGTKIKGLGRQRDAVRSTKDKKVLTIGLNWLVSAIHIKLPWCSRTWAFPFLTILMPPKRPLSSSKNRNDLNKKTKHKTLNDWACQVAFLLRRWLGSLKKVILIADSCFATYKLANTCVDLGITLISRIRLDARFYSPPPVELKKGRGRKRIVGKRLPTLQQILETDTSTWTVMEVTWYGGESRKVEFLTGTCFWYGYGIRPVPIRWVLVRDPCKNFQTVGLFSTDVDKPAHEILEAFISRWQIEVTFEEARRHLGIETQRQWSDQAIDRTTPCLFASYSIISLTALEFLQANKETMPIQRSSWYKKKHVTFSDVLAYVRIKLLRANHFLGVEKKHDLGKFNFEELILQMAAA
jgi:hypothetical protein